MNYCYKVTKKLKEDENFKKIFPIEDSESFTKTVSFATDSKIVQALIGYLNNEGWQKNAGIDDENQRNALAEQGLKFEEVFSEDGTKKYEIVIDDSLLNEFSTGYLMFDKDGEYKDMLYIGSATDSYPFVFFNTEVIDEHIGDIVSAMIDEGYIKKSKIKKSNK